MTVGIGYSLDLCEATRCYPSQPFLFFWIPASPLFYSTNKPDSVVGVFFPLDFHNAFTIKKTHSICL